MMSRTHAIRFLQNLGNEVAAAHAASAGVYPVRDDSWTAKRRAEAERAIGFAVVATESGNLTDAVVALMKHRDRIVDAIGYVPGKELGDSAVIARRNELDNAIRTLVGMEAVTACREIRTICGCVMDKTHEVIYANMEAAGKNFAEACDHHCVQSFSCARSLVHLSLVTAKRDERQGVDDLHAALADFVEWLEEVPAFIAGA